MIPLLAKFLLTLLIGSSSVLSQNTSALHENSQNCSCYVLDSGPNSSTPTYFQYHRFWDFRNIATDGPRQYLQAPPEVDTSFEDAGGEQVWDQSFLNSDAWNTDWAIQVWNQNATSDFPVRMANSAANVYIRKPSFTRLRQQQDKAKERNRS